MSSKGFLRSVCKQYPWLSCLLIGMLISLDASSIAPLQLYIEITPPGGVLTLPPGRYAGPAVVRRAITIDGQGKAEIDGGGEGTVITVTADNVQIRGLKIIHSGGSHNSVDAGIAIEADHVMVENNVLENVLFGFHLKNANDNILRGNSISSLDRDISLRGDGIRLWYSHGNLIEHNRFTRIRDIAANNSSENRLLNNSIEQSRIGMEFIYSPNNEVAHNTLMQNDTGIAVIYSSDMDIHDNRIAYMKKLTGSGLSFKESARGLVRNNEIAHCNTGLLANSPLDPENRMTAEGNLFAYNVTGIYFYGEKGGHVLHNNRFENNFTDAIGSATPAIRLNDWVGNAWDRYQGFDKDEDGTGDQPYKVYLYTEHLLNDYPLSRFFRGTPMLALLDFAFHLAPLATPELEYSDPKPSVLE